MASFIAWYGKKRTRLQELEKEFLELLRTDVAEARLAKMAESIRTGYIRALKEKRQKHAPSEKNARLYAEIEKAIQWGMDVRQNEIIEAYRDPDRLRKLSSTVRRTTK